MAPAPPFSSAFSAVCAQGCFVQGFVPCWGCSWAISSVLSRPDLIREPHWGLPTRERISAGLGAVVDALAALVPITRGLAVNAPRSLFVHPPDKQKGRGIPPSFRPNIDSEDSFQVLALLFLKWFWFLFRVERSKPVPVLLLGLRVFDSFLWC